MCEITAALIILTIWKAWMNGTVCYATVSVFGHGSFYLLCVCVNGLASLLFAQTVLYILEINIRQHWKNVQHNVDDTDIYPWRLTKGIIGTANIS